MRGQVQTHSKAATYAAPMPAVSAFETRPFSTEHTQDEASSFERDGSSLFGAYLQRRAAAGSVGAGQGTSSLSASRNPSAGHGKTGLPDQLKTGIENLSGYAMDEVSVHYNSLKPAEYQALAYTQGTNIHVAPGQERHLPHEAWHVVQQMAGRVRPTMQMKGVGVNDDAGLEREADVMGQRAFTTGQALFFRGGQGLMARELTHVPQSGMNKSVQRQGKGDTGLKRSASIRRYSKKVANRAVGQSGFSGPGAKQELQNLNDQERAEKLLKYANAELEKAHVPKIKGIVLDPDKNFGNAEFLLKSWNIKINTNNNYISLTNNEVAKLGNAIYHESRHAEQWFRMARLQAANGLDAKTIASQMGIPNDVAQAAEARPLKQTTHMLATPSFAKRQHNKKTEAQSWHDSVYGKDAAQREKVLSKMNTSTKYYNKYKKLPEEADAWDVGDTASAKIKKRLN